MATLFIKKKNNTLINTYEIMTDFLDAFHLLFNANEWIEYHFPL